LTGNHHEFIELLKKLLRTIHHLLTIFENEEPKYSTLQFHPNGRECGSAPSKNENPKYSTLQFHPNESECGSAPSKNENPKYLTLQFDPNESECGSAHWFGTK
jgi:hypothetical protein